MAVVLLTHFSRKSQKTAGFRLLNLFLLWVSRIAGVLHQICFVITVRNISVLALLQRNLKGLVM
jgi:hypothetical protein